CEAGRILHHLKNNIGEERNTILFVGFQAAHTLGRRILEGRERVPIFGEEYAVRARVESIDGYSAHADREEILAYMREIGPQRIRKAFLVHGDAEAALALQGALEVLGMQEVIVPMLGDRFTI
ncbi:MAG: MBL fold metallo-hydrolase, partial [Chloroflexi bacterium]|nr:MBL fold metallo-hydrolase [Chloroflexota bacterium]